VLAIATPNFSYKSLYIKDVYKHIRMQLLRVTNELRPIKLAKKKKTSEIIYSL